MEKSIKDLLIDELRDLLSAEEQIIDALPEMTAAAESSKLKEALHSHLEETKEQINRLHQIYKLLKIKKDDKTCKAMKGLIQEGKDVLKDYNTKSPVRDAALISKAQRIEHYEIAAYGTARAIAEELELNDIADLLQETLDEEGTADKILSKIAEGGILSTGINRQANLLVSKKIKLPSDIIIQAKPTKQSKPKKPTNLQKKAKPLTSKKTKSPPKKKT